MKHHQSSSPPWIIYILTMSLQMSYMQRPLWLSVTRCELAVMRELCAPGFGVILKDGDEDRDRGSRGKSERTKTIGAGLDSWDTSSSPPSTAQRHCLLCRSSLLAHAFHRLLWLSSFLYFHLWSRIHTLAFSFLLLFFILSSRAIISRPYNSISI